MWYVCGGIKNSFIMKNKNVLSVCLILFFPLLIFAQGLSSFPVLATSQVPAGEFDDVLISFREFPTDLSAPVDRIVYFDQKGEEILREGVTEKATYHHVHVPKGTRIIGVFGSRLVKPVYFAYFGKKNYLVEVWVKGTREWFESQMKRTDIPEKGSRVIGVLSDGYGNPVTQARVKGYSTLFNCHTDDRGFYSYDFPVLGADRPVEDRVGASDDLRYQSPVNKKFYYLSKVVTHRREIRWKNLFVSSGERPTKREATVINGADYLDKRHGIAPINSVVVGPYSGSPMGGIWYRVKDLEDYITVVSTSENYVDAPLSHVVAKTIMQASYGERCGLGPYYSSSGYNLDYLNPKKDPLIPSESNQKCDFDNRISSFAFNAINFIGKRRLREANRGIYLSHYFAGKALDQRGQAHPSYVSFNTDNLEWYFDTDNKEMSSEYFSRGFSRAYGKDLKFY